MMKFTATCILLRFKFHAELHVSLYNRFLQQNEVRKNKSHIVLMKW